MKYFIFRFFTLILISGFIFQSCNKDEETEEPCNQAVTVNLGADKIVQDGSTITLDAGASGPTFTYLWNTGAVTKTIEVSETGKYFVTVISCSHTASDTVRVEVNYPVIKLNTDFGEFNIWLYHQTSQHRANFLSLTDDGFYNGLIFHRVIENFMIQGGDPDGTGYGGPGYTIPAEIISGLTHVYGAVGAARDNNPEKESNGSQFYIVSNPNGRHDLDGNYTVFGIVFSGLDAVQSISQVETDGNDRPLTDVVMDPVSTVYYTAEQLMNEFGFEVPLP